MSVEKNFVSERKEFFMRQVDKIQLGAIRIEEATL